MAKKNYDDEITNDTFTIIAKIINMRESMDKKLGNGEISEIIFEYMSGYILRDDQIKLSKNIRNSMISKKKICQYIK